MAVQRYINTKFWSDTFIVNLSRLERYLFLYFLTNEHTTICGFYELPMKRIISETDMKKSEVLKCLESLKGKVFYIDGWVYVKNFAKHQKATPNIQTGIEKCFNRVPEHIKKKATEMEKQIDAQCHPMPSNNSNMNINNNKNINMNKNSKVKNVNPQDEELTNLLFDLVKQNFPFVKSKPTLKDYEEMNRIHRLDGRDYMLIELIVKWCQNDNFWKKNIRSVSKLRKQFERLMIEAKVEIDSRSIKSYD